MFSTVLSYLREIRKPTHNHSFDKYYPAVMSRTGLQGRDEETIKYLLSQSWVRIQTLGRLHMVTSEVTNE